MIIEKRDDNQENEKEEEEEKAESATNSKEKEEEQDNSTEESTTGYFVKYSDSFVCTPYKEKDVSWSKEKGDVSPQKETDFIYNLNELNSNFEQAYLEAKERLNGVIPEKDELIEQFQNELKKSLCIVSIKQ